MSTQQLTFQNPLQSRLLSSHPQLQEAAMTGNGACIKLGEKGPHVIALQKALNSLCAKKLVWYDTPAGVVRPPSWDRVEENGDFDNNTHCALKAFQDWANRSNRRISHNLAGLGATPETQAYKNEYSRTRTRVKGDGIVGPVTLSLLDGTLQWQKNLEK